MNGMITTDENYDLDSIIPRLKEYTTGKVVEKVTCSEKTVLKGNGKRVALLLLGAFVLALPVTAYEIFSFCSPGLKQLEKNMMLLGMIFGTVFFLAGVLFAYFITVPFMLRFLIAFSADVTITASISIQEYMSFLLMVFTIFGVIFELPVLSVILTALGVVKPSWLVKARRVMIVAIFFVAAVITPPDIDRKSVV